MRNLKKILALVLALVMALSVMSVASAKKLDEYTDAGSVSQEYVTAVEVVSQLGVLNGMTADEFGASGYLTRAQLAAIIYRLTTGDVGDQYATNFTAGAAANFDDVTDEFWGGRGAGYIGYCADAGFLEGWGGNYYPNEYMTGYQALAALLRAMGYNQPGQFSGSAWTVAVAQIARESGVSAGVVTDLNQPITREQTAQFIHNALFAEMVRYGSIYGYEGLGTNLAEATFDVVSPKGGEPSAYIDKWGRPATVWVDEWDNVIVDIAYEPDFTSTVAVDECDIAKALGLTRDTPIQNAYIDGDAARVDDNWTLEPLAETELIGAQGRLLEVYNLGRDGVHIVEINTYLAQVVRVTPETLDKNNHPVPASITLAIYEDAENNDTADWTVNVQTTGYELFDWVLVYVNHPAYLTDENADGTPNDRTDISVAASDIRKAPVAGTNLLTSWTNVPATHTFGMFPNTVTYTDADKFELNDGELASWIILTDDTPEKNVIGLVEPTTNYLVIERIEWQDAPGAIGGGYALADFAMADGSKLANQKVSMVNGISVICEKTAGVPSAGEVSEDYRQNGVYYDHIWSYTVDANGAYVLTVDPDSDTDTKHQVNDHIYDIKYDADNTSNYPGATYNNQTATINSNTNVFVANDFTVFLYANADGYTYTAYVGKGTAPNVYDATMCVLVNDLGYASLVVVSEYKLVNNTFLAFIGSSAQVSTKTPVDTVTDGEGYAVYRLGSAAPEVVWDDASGTLKALIDDTGKGSGIYQLEVDTAGNIITAEFWVDDFDGTESDVDPNADDADELIEVDRVAAASLVGHSLITKKYAATLNNGELSKDPVGNAEFDGKTSGYDVTTLTVNADYDVTAATNYLLVTVSGKDAADPVWAETAPATIRAATAAELAAGDVVLVAYNKGTDDAVAVYIVRYVAPSAAPATQYFFDVTHTTYTTDTFVIEGDVADVLEVAADVEVTADDKFNYTIVEKVSGLQVSMGKNLAFSATAPVSSGANRIELPKTGLQQGVTYTITINFVMNDGEAVRSLTLDITA